MAQPPTAPTDLALRHQLIDTLRRANRSGLNHGKCGNASVRVEGGLLISPSGIAYDQLEPEDIVFMTLDGTPSGCRKPSSEWRFHVDVMRARPDVGAVLHTHSMFATTLACLRREVPPFNYMIAFIGASTLPCADYALVASQDLSDAALRALGPTTKACLLANHGLLVVESDLEKVFDLAVEVEALCAMYWRCLQVGEPAILSDDQMAEVFEAMKLYQK